MSASRIEDFKGGWFIGDFEPSLLRTQGVEVAVKNYVKNDYESAHYHKIATEYTVILDGEVSMNCKSYSKGDIITMLPGHSTDFLALEDSRCLVVKIPGAVNDKYIV